MTDPVAAYTGVLAVLTAVLAAVSMVQIKYLTRADRASKAALDHATTATAQELRAYVFVHRTEMKRDKHTRFGAPGTSAPVVTNRITGEVSYSYENTGKTPAKNVHVAAKAAWIRCGEVLDFSNVGDLRLIGPLGPEAKFSEDIRPDGPEFGNIKDAAKSGEFELHLWGRIEYDDVFSKERRWTTFHCYIGGAIGYDDTLHTVEPGNGYA